MPGLADLIGLNQSPNNTPKAQQVDRVTLTNQLRQEWGRQNIASQTQGQSFPVWQEWLPSQGYMLAPDNLVSPLPSQPIK